MSEPTRPLSIRLAESDIDQLAARARRISGTPTGVARELIRSGLTDGDPFTQAERLLKIERRLASLSQDLQAVAKSNSQNGGSLSHVESMFDDLLHALSGQPTSQED
tara:strand:+ start:269857 stop:270177 length:321 start_codon:yes stop_codon:yes gene_type:complete